MQQNSRTPNKGPWRGRGHVNFNHIERISFLGFVCRLRSDSLRTAASPTQLVNHSTRSLTHGQVNTHTITIITLFFTLNAHLSLTRSGLLWSNSLTAQLTPTHDYHHHTLFHSECSPIAHSLWTSLNSLTACQTASVRLLFFCYISLCNLVSHLRFALSTLIRNFLTTTPTRAYDLHACLSHATANSAKRPSKRKVASVFIGRNVSGTRRMRH